MLTIAFLYSFFYLFKFDFFLFFLDLHVLYLFYSKSSYIYYALTNLLFLASYYIYNLFPISCERTNYVLGSSCPKI